MRSIDRHGIEISLPDDWDGRVQRRAALQLAPMSDGRAAPGSRDVSRPVLHLSNRTLPATLADFGGDVVPGMRSDDVFLALIDYGEECADTALFAARGVPTLAPSHFAQNRMARHVPGRSASQKFFTAGGRGFCLYAVVGSHSRRMVTVPRLSRVASTLKIRAVAS
ncbi:hypothetical protein AWH69_04730 [Janibacter melonis]|uniref:Uncharacterized protein n=1 Tax=Janibacter melonis TaxID=262209 RepID=A0A176QCM6_9MICO|nr:hypothetical protein [Janibacter melonis]MBD5829941.1 hypothetical protein [Janibacter melonis]OAB87400.1 hypothetical protein AWH69_04730 [Janibacter melonis]